MTPKELSDICRNLEVLNYAKEIGDAAAAGRRFGISGETFYKWKRAFARDGERALINSKPYLRKLTALFSKFSLPWSYLITVFGSQCFDIICTCW
jgi:hypothetical protein